MKQIILIGGSDGLGRSFAELCTNSDIQIINISRTPCTIEGVKNIKCDLAIEADVKNAANEVKTKYSNFDAIVNTAAIVGMEKMGEITYEKFNHAWQVNTIAPLFFLSELFNIIVKNEADVLNVGTTMDLKEGLPDQLAYTATKYGLRGGSYNIGMELKKTKSRMIYVHCGGMNTEMHKKDYGAIIEDPNAWMKTEDVAKILLSLLKLPKQIEISEITINRKGRRL